MGEDVKEALREAVSKGVRGIKVTIDVKRPRLGLKESFTATGSFADDFAKFDWAALLEDALPCILLLRTADEAGTIPGTKEGVFVYVGWMPEGTPVRQRMNYSSALATLRTQMEDLEFKEMTVGERSEMVLKDVIELAKELTLQDRMAMATGEELLALKIEEERNLQVAAFEANKVNNLTVEVKFQDSFHEVLAKVTGDMGNALLAHIVGDDNDEISGELLEEAEHISDLKFKLPAEKACFAIVRPEASKAVIVHWIPKEAPAALKATSAAYVDALVSVLQEKCEGYNVIHVEVTEDGDLNDKLEG